MMELPLDEAISLDDTVAFHRALVHSGASIVEMNCVRKHFSAVKGGRLALAAGRAQTLSLLVSDVPPAHLDALGSGPTVADPLPLRVPRDARALWIDGAISCVGAAILRIAHLPKTPKADDLTARICKLLDSDDLAEAARIYAATSASTPSSTTRATTGAMTRLRILCSSGCASCAGSIRESA